MSWLVSHPKWKWAIGIVAVLFLSTAYAVSSTTPKVGPKIVIDKARSGESCVEDTAYMRKNHMKVLLHQRDETVHKGIRTPKHSLKNCVSCHASAKDERVVGTDEHFCQGCHTYAAVKMDCWECHTTKAKPKTAAATATLPAVGMPSVGGEIK